MYKDPNIVQRNKILVDKFLATTQNTPTIVKKKTNQTKNNSKSSGLQGSTPVEVGREVTKGISVVRSGSGHIVRGSVKAVHVCDSGDDSRTCMLACA